MTEIGLRVTSTLDDAPVDEIVNVYRDAFTAPGYDETPEDVARFHEGLPRHAARDGFRLALARDRDGGDLTGFAYGYTGEPGQWWTTSSWTGSPASSPTSGSAGTSSSLSSPYGLPHRRALLGTWPDDRPARRLYERAGWRDLAPIDPDSTPMGLELPG